MYKIPIKEDFQRQSKFLESSRKAKLLLNKYNAFFKNSRLDLAFFF